jgi:hypothetical protein
VKKASSDKSSDQALLVSVAESIGSTLGAIAAKADAAQKALLSRDVAREGKKPARRNKRATGSRKRRASARKTRGRKRTAPRRARAKR